MKIIDSIFIYFSKIYLKLFGDRNDYWLVLPMHLLSFIFTLNIYIITSYFVRISVYYSILSYLILYFICFLLLGKRMNLKYVTEYNLSKNVIYVISLMLIVDILFLTYMLDLIKNLS